VLGAFEYVVWFLGALLELTVVGCSIAKGSSGDTGHQRLHVGGIFRQHRTLQDPSSLMALGLPSMAISIITRIYS